MLHETEFRNRGSIVWLCRCVCGNLTEVSARNLTIGKTKSCGCLRISDIKDKKIGRLKALEKIYRRSKNGDVIWKCQCDCGNISYVTSGALNAERSLSCGCLQRDLQSKVRGDKNPSYNPELSDEERLKNRYDLYGNNVREWSKKVMRRDDYTCQVCGKRGGKLNAHHLNSWDVFEDERFDITNGVTLCEYCHIEFHSLFGFGRNTRIQFKEHILNKIDAYEIEK